MRNALTVDVEDYFQVGAFASTIRPEDWESWPSRVERNSDRLLELFEKHEAKATFFVLGWIAERFPQLVRRIVEAGHEVASHGYSHQLVYKQTPDVFRKETRQSKEILEDLLGQPVTGYRAASYSITPKSRWALDILVELGFTWDSSLFPIRHDVYGMPNIPKVPYRLQTDNGGSLIEFPLTTFPVAGQRVPVAGGGYFRLFPYSLTEFFLRRLNKAGQPFIFYLHPWEIDPGQPRVPGLPLKSRFRHYNNLSRCEARLERLLTRFPFARVTDVLADLALDPAADAPSVEAIPLPAPA